MLRIQGFNLDNYLTDLQFQLIRTYKGEIPRTLTGKIVSFPTSFTTVGFTFSLLGPKSTIYQAQQLLLSANTVKLSTSINNTQIEGNFSCTQVSVEEARDKSDRSLILTASVVSDGSDITKPGGAYFTIKRNGTTVVSNCAFGKVYKVTGDPVYLNGALLPSNNVLVLGDTEVVTE